MSEPKPTYIVDDDVAVRESMSLLKTLPVRCFASAEEFLMAAPLLEPGCVVGDIRMPGTDGIELIEKLAARSLDFPVIVITAYGEVPLAVRALKAGAVDSIEKPFPGPPLSMSSCQVCDRSVPRRIHPPKRMTSHSGSDRSRCANAR